MTANTDDPRAIIERIEASHTQMMAEFEGLSDDQLVAPGMTGAWSGKDVLAHLARWQEAAIRVIEHHLRGERPPENYRDEQAWNERWAEEDHGLTLRQARRRFEETQQRLMDLLRGLSDEQWAPRVQRWAEGSTVYHYPEHIRAIQEWRSRPSSESIGESQARRLEAAADELVGVLRQPDVSEERLRTAPAEGEWTAMQVLGHTVEMLGHWPREAKRMLEQTGGPAEFGRMNDDPGRLAGVQHGETGHLDELLQQLEEEARDAATMIRGLYPDQRAQTVTNVSYGETTIGEMIERHIVRHAETHLTQIKAALNV